MRLAQPQYATPAGRLGQQQQRLHITASISPSRLSSTSRPASSSKKSGRTGADNGLPGNRRRTPKALPLSTTFVIQIIVTSLNVFVRLQFLNINNTSHQPNVDDLTVS